LSVSVGLAFQSVWPKKESSRLERKGGVPGVPRLTKAGL
jgi:hypothetical protein